MHSICKGTTEKLNYNYAEFAGLPLYDRFAEWVIGYGVWRDYTEDLQTRRTFDEFRRMDLETPEEASEPTAT
jgi:hypothetical protein